MASVSWLAWNSKASAPDPCCPVAWSLRCPVPLPYVGLPYAVMSADRSAVRCSVQRVAWCRCATPSAGHALSLDLQVAAEYMAWCPTRGESALTTLLTHLPVAAADRGVFYVDQVSRP
jgi:hypothetical protein